MDFAPEKVDNQVLLDYGVLDTTMPRVGEARQCSTFAAVCTGETIVLGEGGEGGPAVWGTPQHAASALMCSSHCAPQTEHTHL